MDIELGRQGSSHTEQVTSEEVKVEGSEAPWAVEHLEADATEVDQLGAKATEAEENTRDSHCCTMRIGRFVSSLPFRVQNHCLSRTSLMVPIQSSSLYSNATPRFLRMSIQMENTFHILES